jgi:hypothetical protein
MPKDDFITSAAAIRLLLRVRYPEEPWVDEITSDWYLHLDHQWDPIQISAFAALNAATGLLQQEVSAGNARLRGQLNGRRSSDIEGMWCYVGEIDAFAGTLTVPPNSSAPADAPCRVWQNVLCRKVDIERIVPRMRESDLTPEVHSAMYRFSVSRHGDNYGAVLEKIKAGAPTLTEGPRPTKPPTPPKGAPVVDLADPEAARLKPGPKPKKTERVKKAIMDDIEKGKLTWDELRNMKQEALAEKYDVSRETAVKVRKAILVDSGDRVGIGNSDKK